MTSNAVFDEVRVASAAGITGILLLHPGTLSSEREGVQWILDKWEKKFSKAIDLNDPNAEIDLQNRLAAALKRDTPEVEAGELISCLEKKRTLLAPTKLPLPDMNKLLSGNGTRDDALSGLPSRRRFFRTAC